MSPDAIHGRDSAGPAATHVGHPNRRRKAVKAVAVLIYPLYLVGLLWLGDKLYWRLAFHVPLTGASNEELAWTLYYPEVAQVAADHARHAAEPGRFEVVLLGGSVMEQVAPHLQGALGERLGGGVRVHSLAKSAHTSRDSYLKYGRIDKDINLIILYHGINDARMNCVERSGFRDDYSHCDWYRGFYDTLATGAPSPLRIAGDRVLGRIPLGTPKPKALALGGDVKTEAPFRRNIESIVEDAGRRGIPVVLMSFAYHLPADYSREHFDRGELDYGAGPHKLPAEVWGLPANVARTIDAHNRAILELSKKHNNVIYIDQKSLLPNTGRVFCDPCHLTAAGCREFSRNVADRLPTTRFRRPMVSGESPGE